MWTEKGAAVGIALAIVFAAIAWAGLMGPERGAEALPTYWDAPVFALLDQSGDTLRSGDLLGGPWVASFVFTHCAGACPLITARMAQVRDSLRSRGRLGRDVRLVSFSVDPARDTPAVLRDYAARFGGDPPEAWAFLTGSPPGAVRRLIQEGFRLTALVPDGPGTEAPPAPAGGYQVTHSPRVVLLDARGRVRATYPGTDPDMPSRVLADLGRLGVP